MSRIVIVTPASLALGSGCSLAKEHPGWARSNSAELAIRAKFLGSLRPGLYLGDFSIREDPNFRDDQQFLEQGLA